jgi:hypothetical protein
LKTLLGELGGGQTERSALMECGGHASAPKGSTDPKEFEFVPAGRISDDALNRVIRF